MAYREKKINPDVLHNVYRDIPPISKCEELQYSNVKEFKSMDLKTGDIYLITSPIYWERWIEKETGRSWAQRPQPRLLCTYDDALSNSSAVKRTESNNTKIDIFG